MLAIDIQQGFNQLTMIVQGEWFAVSGEVGSFTGWNIWWIAINHRVMSALHNVRDRMPEITMDKDRFCIAGLFGE